MNTPDENRTGLNFSHVAHSIITMLAPHLEVDGPEYERARVLIEDAQLAAYADGFRRGEAEE